MTTHYTRTRRDLAASPKTWLVTGAAGFIGSHLLETLLALNQHVVGVDNFSTGKPQNLDDVLKSCSRNQRQLFRFIEGDIRNLEICQQACRGVDYVLHQAALGSVPRSIQNPIAAHHNNVTGFLNMLVAARDQKVQRFIYASSSSVYGDNTDELKTEERRGQPLSPYAMTKCADEMYADVFSRTYGLDVTGLRYFNVFGPRQSPDGPYAAVIPRWIEALMNNRPAQIFGDGSTSRDFSFVANAVQANLLAAATTNPAVIGKVFNIAVGARTSLTELFNLIRAGLVHDHPFLKTYEPVYEAFRPGDIRNSQADISKARDVLGYEPTHSVREGLSLTVDWFKVKAASFHAEPVLEAGVG